jgi:hypothetical protein
MKSLFYTEAYNEVKNRIKTISEDSTPVWGKMNAGQMFKHCQTPFDIIDGTIEFNVKIGFIKKLIFSMMKSMMYNDKLWKQSVQTPREFVIDYEVDTSTEREKLLIKVDHFHNRKDQEIWNPHPIFGKFKKDQWGKMNYKHLDHHLRQFGV